MASGPSVTVAPPATKKSLFKKSAWAAKSTQPDTEADEGIDLFSRSKEIFSDVVAENEKEWLQKRARRNKSRLAETIDRGDVEGGGSKRRRISMEVELDSSPGEEEVAARDLQTRREDSSTVLQSTSQPVRSTFAKAKQTSPNIRPAFTCSSKPETVEIEIIALSDSDEEEASPSAEAMYNAADNYEANKKFDLIHESKQKLTGEVEVVHIEEEEEFPELIAAAREKAKSQLLSRLHTKTRSSSLSNGTGSAVIFELTPPRPQADPILQILVSSRIQGTKSLICRRKLSQRLKDVRLAWCDKQTINGQPMTPQVKAMIFLTWRGHRLFDSSTGRALGLELENDGTLSINGDGIDEGRIQLEAWTEDEYQAHKKAIEDERKKATQDPLEEEELFEPQPAPVVAQLRITLKAREYPELKVRVRPVTVMSKLIDQFRKKRNIPADKEITIRLDGDLIDPSTSVEDADLDDLTTVDVHVK